MAIGDQCYAIKLGIQQSDIVVPNNTWRKRIEKGFSNFEATINITGLTQINLISNLSMQILSGDISGTPAYCGILNLTSTNTTESINEIIALPSSVSFASYRLKPESGLIVSIIDKTVAGGSANIILNFSQLDIDGTFTEYAIFDRYMLTLGNVTPDFHLEYTNVITGGGVQSVTDDGNGVVSVDNTDPANPIIKFYGVNVDGVTITGDGTSGNPLVATTGGGPVDMISPFLLMGG